MDIHIVYSCTHQPCHIQKMTFISLLPLLSSYILSAPLSSKLHKPRRDDLDIAFKAENITIILFSQHWLYIHVCIKCCQSQTEAFLTKDESSTLYTYKGHFLRQFHNTWELQISFTWCSFSSILTLSDLKIARQLGRKRSMVDAGWSIYLKMLNEVLLKHNYTYSYFS